MIYDNILQTIGNTPVVRLNRMAPDHVEVYVKVESFNPMASVKDRLAFAIIKDAHDSGALAPGQTVIEATSGNTGIALAMVCAATGHPFVATMADSFSVERRKIMRGLGARVILTPAAERGSGMVKKAEELAARNDNYFIPHQFKNAANPDIHRQTTAEEIWKDTDGRSDEGIQQIGHALAADLGETAPARFPDIAQCQTDGHYVVEGEYAKEGARLQIADGWMVAHVTDDCLTKDGYGSANQRNGQDPPTETTHSS